MLGVVSHAWNSSTPEAEAGEWKDSSQPVLHSKILSNKREDRGREGKKIHMDLNIGAGEMALCSRALVHKQRMGSQVPSRSQARPIQEPGASHTDL